MKPLSVEMACLLDIQNEIQAVCSINFATMKEAIYIFQVDYSLIFPISLFS